MEHTCLAVLGVRDQVKNEHFAKKSSQLRKNLTFNHLNDLRQMIDSHGVLRMVVTTTIRGTILRPMPRNY